MLPRMQYIDWVARKKKKKRKWTKTDYEVNKGRVNKKYSVRIVDIERINKII